jgi:hypothetical protein
LVFCSKKNLATLVGKLRCPGNIENLIVFFRIEARFKGREIVSGFARRQNEIFFADSSPSLAIIRGHLSNDRRHLGSPGEDPETAGFVKCCVVNIGSCNGSAL